MFAAGFAFPVIRYIDMKNSGYIINLDDGFFACALFMVSCKINCPNMIKKK